MLPLPTHCRFKYLFLLSLTLLTLAANGLAATHPAITAEISREGLPLAAMSMGLLGGLALFLFGMDLMAEGLKSLAGDKLKILLARLTKNRLAGVFTGAAVTAIIQSSSVTTVLTVGFVTAGILSLTQAVGIIFGANIGTTLTAQVIAFKVTEYALLMIALGFAAQLLGRRPKIRHSGSLLLGLGLIFLGMQIMGDSMQPLRSYEPFMELLTAMRNPLLGIVVAAIFTALVQSSSATTGIVIVMAGQGLISLEAGIALVLGANVGTCVTAVLASIGKTVEARQTSVVHILFNSAGVLLWVAFVPILADLVLSISPEFTELEGKDRLAAETPRQIANAHTIFNVVNTFLFLPFAGGFAYLAQILIREPARPETTLLAEARKQLESSLVEVPSVALEQTQQQLVAMGKFARNYLHFYHQAFLKREAGKADQLVEKDDIIDQWDELVVNFLEEISHRPLNQKQAHLHSKLVNISNEIEHIGDVVERNLRPLLQQVSRETITFSEETQGELTEFKEQIDRLFQKALKSMESNQPLTSEELSKNHERLTQLEITFRERHSRRLEKEGLQEEGLTRNLIYVDYMSYLRRINTHLETLILEWIR